MTSSIARTTLIALAALLIAPLGNAADTKAVAPQAAASKAATSPKEVKSSASAKPKTVAPVKLMDINSATKEELKTLPGIGDAEADKIIAGRPYGSKAWLISHKILPQDKYPAIRGLIIAKQASKDAAKNAAAVTKKK